MSKPTYLRYEITGFAQIGTTRQDGTALITQAGNTVFVEPGYKARFEKRFAALLESGVLKAEKPASKPTPVVSIPAKPVVTGGGQP